MSTASFDSGAMRDLDMTCPRTGLLSLAFALSLFCLGCHPSQDSAPTAVATPAETPTPAEAAAHDTLTQVSTIEILLAGGYYGWASVGDMAAYGDFGLGTFLHLDGEMIQADGTVFQVTADGAVHQPAGEAGTPFYVTTPFETDQTIEIGGWVDFPGLQSQLAASLPSQNMIYAVRIRGRFDSLKTRSVPAQSLPYPPLGEVVKTQPTFAFEDVEGTLVGFYFPDSFAKINVPGFHFHFINQDKTGGGHVLELQASNLTAEVDVTTNFQLILPEAAEFTAFELPSGNGNAVEATEKSTEKSTEK